VSHRRSIWAFSAGPSTAIQAMLRSPCLLLYGNKLRTASAGVSKVSLNEYEPPFKLAFALTKRAVVSPRGSL
jgi:hypothetical protein